MDTFTLRLGEKTYFASAKLAPLLEAPPNSVRVIDIVFQNDIPSHVGGLVYTLQKVLSRHRYLTHFTLVSTYPRHSLFNEIWEKVIFGHLVRVNYRRVYVTISILPPSKYKTWIDPENRTLAGVQMVKVPGVFSSFSTAVLNGKLSHWDGANGLEHLRFRLRTSRKRKFVLEHCGVFGIQDVADIAERIRQTPQSLWKTLDPNVHHASRARKMREIAHAWATRRRVVATVLHGGILSLSRDMVRLVVQRLRARDFRVKWRSPPGEFSRNQTLCAALAAFQAQNRSLRAATRTLKKDEQSEKDARKRIMRAEKELIEMKNALKKHPEKIKAQRKRCKEEQRKTREASALVENLLEKRPKKRRRKK